MLRPERPALWKVPTEQVFAEMMEGKISARLIRPHVSREPAFQALVSTSISPGLRVSGARPSHSAWAVWRVGLSGLYRDGSKRFGYKYG
jgi:hypothetical protein